MPLVEGLDALSEVVRDTATGSQGAAGQATPPRSPPTTRRAPRTRRRADTVPGDPEASGAAMLALVHAAEPPLRVFFGDVGLPMIRQEVRETGW